MAQDQRQQVPNHREKTVYEEACVFHISGALGHRRRGGSDKHTILDGPEHIFVQHIDNDTEYDGPADTKFHDDSKHYGSVCHSELHHPKYNRSVGDAELNYTEHN